MSRSKDTISYKNSMSYKTVTRIKSIGLNIVLVILTVLMLTPLLWTLATSLSPNTPYPPLL